jgi:hypothetical protein
VTSKKVDVLVELSIVHRVLDPRNDSRDLERASIVFPHFSLCHAHYQWTYYYRESVNHDYQADVHALSMETSSLQVHVVWHTSHVRSSSSLATSYLNCTPSGHRHTSHHQSSRFLQGIQISSSTLLYFGSQHHYYTGANKT